MVAYLNLSIAAERAGRGNEALSWGRLATEVGPDDARPHVQYSRLLAAHGDAAGARRELALASRAAACLVLRREPDNAFARRRLGSALVELGQTEQGLAELRRAVSLDEGDSANHLALGEGLVAAGLSSDAVREYERVLAIQPNGPAADAARKRIQSMAPPAHK